MGIVLFLIVMLVSANVWSRTEGPVFWTYLGTLVLSYFVGLFLAGALQQAKPLKEVGTGNLMKLTFPFAYIVVCGGATALVYFQYPLVRILAAVGVIPVWLCIAWVVSQFQDYGGGASGTHDMYDVSNPRRPVRVGPASRRDVYRSKHGDNWDPKAGHGIIKTILFCALVAVLWQFGFYEAIGTLSVTAAISGIYA